MYIDRNTHRPISVQYKYKYMHSQIVRLGGNTKFKSFECKSCTLTKALGRYPLSFLQNC